MNLEAWADAGLSVTVTERVAVARLNRPAVLNAIDPPLMRAIVEAFDIFDRDDDVWAVMLTSTGGRAFCAGIDLKAANAPEHGSWIASMPTGGVDRNMFEVVLECSKPTIAALNGAAVGAGFELALACDMRVAAAGINLGLPEAKRGMGVNFGSHMLPRLMPTAIAFEMLYTGELITAERALEVGLLNRVVSSDDLHDVAYALCRTVAGNAPLTVRRVKANITKGASLPLGSALRLREGADPYRSDDRTEGVAAFLEKRTPVWRGR